jgi:hypothetical protein
VLSGAGLPHPNQHFRNVAKQNFVSPPFFRNGRGEMVSHFGDSATVIQPHTRNTLAKKTVSRTYKTQFGASEAMPSDTAFHRNPPTETQKPIPLPATYVLRVPRSMVASFVSKNNQWMDANNSFTGGLPSVGTGDTGRGRWQTVKRGAAG